MRYFLVYLFLAPLLMASFIVSAAEHHAKVIHILKYEKAAGKTEVRAAAAGLVNMDEILDGSGGCGQAFGPAKIEGIQFSQSGVTLESFRFTDKRGEQWSVPTNIGKLSNAERREANSFIKTGKTYYLHMQVCGNGGYPSLINLYDLSITFDSK